MKTNLKIFMLSLLGAVFVTAGVANAQNENTIIVPAGSVGMVSSDPTATRNGVTADEKAKLQAAFDADAAANNPHSKAAAGTVSKLDSSRISLKSPDQPRTSSYSLNKSTTYVDNTGSRVSKSAVTKGSPVAISYVQNGDKKIVTQVMIKSTVP